MARSDIVIVLVPGGMGSTLTLDGLEVWNFELKLPPDLSGLRMILSPALLLPWVPLQPVRLLSVYDDFVAFLGSNGYTEAQHNLFLCPFDWRQGMKNAATLLANFINTTVVPNLGSKRILFITHSYGTMVTRWALTLGSPTDPIDSSRVERVVAAGPYMLGIVSAFRNMLEMPNLATMFNDLFDLLKAANPALADQVQVPLSNSLMASTAQLESLPTFPILQGGANPPPVQPYLAFDWSGWPPELVSLRNSVQTNLQNLAQAAWPNIPRTVFASSSYSTDTGYVLDSSNQIQSHWVGSGDGVVLIESALAYCGPGEDVTVSYPHEELLDDPALRSFLVNQHII
jgi:pimeloyl-ACP methyl ester carboxylesterase